MMRRAFLHLVAALGLPACAQVAGDLDRPARTYVLPDVLREVSALTDVDQRIVACLQDEAASIYLYDLAEGVVRKELSFGAPGDYEGLTRVGDAFYALRSDGLVSRLLLEDRRAVVLDTFRLPVPHTNIEGLGYDERTGRILITPKDIIRDTRATMQERLVYAYDPVARALDAQPALRIVVDEVIEQADALGIDIPTRISEDGDMQPRLKLRPSSIAVHPFTGHFHLLSAVDRALLVLDREGRLVKLHFFDRVLFPKPEGITFLPNGDMLVSTERKEGSPTIHYFTTIP